MLVSASVPARRLALAGLVGALVAACGPSAPSDLTAPRVLRVSPPGPVVQVDDTFEVVFSETIAFSRIEDDSDHVVIVPRVEVDDAWISDVENPPLIDSRRDDTVPVTLAWKAGGTRVTVTPTSPLRPATPYALVVSADVRDLSGNPLGGPTGSKASLVYEITTDAGPPSVVSTTATGVVPPNIKRLRVTFNQPVQGVSRDTLRLLPTGGADEPALEAIEISPARDEATLILADGASCERLTPGGEYQLLIEEGVVDDAARRMPVQSFPFSAGGACDLTPNQILSVEVLAFDDLAVGLFSTTKPSTTELRFGRAGGPLDCEGQPCPVRGADARTADDGAYRHEVQAGGLTLGAFYDWAVYAEDDLGFRAQASGQFVVVELPPIALNELLPNPEGEESAGEFLELTHFGDAEEISLAGWSIQIEDKAPCVFGPDAPSLSPRTFLVVARESFDAGAWPGLDEARVFRADSGPDCTATALTLSNQVQTVRLLDEGGRPVSVYPGAAGLNPTNSHEGDSIDRIDPEADDVASSFCFPDGPPTPGATNSAVISGCQP